MMGFTLEERREEPVTNGVPTPLPFNQMNLDQYAIIVLGSNNAAYSDEDVDAIEAYVRNGGGLLIISDANFGQDWPDAPTSDQPFLDRFGLVMNQDRGTYTITEDEYLSGTHPILDGVSAFDGEGVSPVTVADVPNGLRVQILANAEGLVRRNDTQTGQGSSTEATADDAALLYGGVGTGRLAVHFDRNTFFNENGAGTDITRLDNRTFARNLFGWLSGAGPLPVELNSIDATFQDEAVLLTWETLTETNHSGFGVQRQSDAAVSSRSFYEIGFVQGAGTTSYPRSYRFRDPAPTVDSSPLAYRLRLVALDGTVEYSPTVTVRLPSFRTQLAGVSPSPISHSTVVRYMLAEAATVDLSLFDVLGRLVQRIRSGVQSAGSWQAPLVVESIPSGRYFLRLSVNGITYEQPLTIVK
jgi:hypothetical protein